MLELARYWVLASYVIGLVLVLDQLRHPAPEWQAAGRHRRFWVALTLGMGFHGLGQFAAAAYFAVVVPRFRGARDRVSRKAMRHAAKLGRSERSRTTVEELVLVAGLLVFASSLIHSAAIADHFEEHWLFGVFFAVAAVGQAAWTALVYRDPTSRRVLVAGAVASAALIAVWAISRTVGVPVGPTPWRPEPVGAADVFSKLDELMALALVGIALARLRAGRPWHSRTAVRVATMLAGPLFIWSILAAFGGGHRHV